MAGINLDWAARQGRVSVSGNIYEGLAEKSGDTGYGFEQKFDFKHKGVDYYVYNQEGYWFLGVDDYWGFFDDIGWSWSVEGRQIFGLDPKKEYTADDIIKYLTRPTQAGDATRDSRARTIEAKKNIQSDIREERDLLETAQTSQILKGQNAIIQKQVEQYDAIIESQRSMESLINTILESQKTPSVIQTLFLDRQAKTYLPSSIRSRGFVGASTSSGQTYG